MHGRRIEGIERFFKGRARGTPRKCHSSSDPDRRSSSAPLLFAIALAVNAEERRPGRVVRAGARDRGFDVGAEVVARADADVTTKA
jgi:hypothetical protein